MSNVINVHSSFNQYFPKVVLRGPCTVLILLFLITYFVHPDKLMLNLATVLRGIWKYTTVRKNALISWTSSNTCLNDIINLGPTIITHL